MLHNEKLTEVRCPGCFGKMQLYYTNIATDPDKPCVAYKECREALREAPAVDAVEVVRCKDCAFYRPYIQEMYKGKGDCEEHDAMVYDDDFCSCGRKLVKKDAAD